MELDTMNIYAIRGHKIKVTEESAKNGGSYDQNKIAQYLEIEKEYSVFETDVHGFTTDVFLEDIFTKTTNPRRVYFNSVNFVDVNQQSKYDDLKHEDANRW